MTNLMQHLEARLAYRYLRRPRAIWAWLLLSCLVIGGAWAQAVPGPALDTEQIYAQLERDAMIETRLDVDFDGDGEVDTVFVAGSRNGRKVVAMQARRSSKGNDHSSGKHRAIGTLHLSPRPLVPAQLSFADGVLTIVDQTGNDTTTQARYRFKFDRELGTLRLLALDTGRYSRKRAHDSVRLNWDPDSGRQALAYGKPAFGPDSEAGYRYDDVRRTCRAPMRLTMERTPTGDQMLVRAGVRLGQGAPVE